jgi:hypothetical protein
MHAPLFGRKLGPRVDGFKGLMYQILK